jgi:acyl-CoA reductase-like NAD-dependent aldehyde dehydrogenase
MININDHLLTQKLVSDKRISFLSFIGSSNVGWKLKSMLSPGTKCAMEHGGIGSVIIDKNTILGDIIPSITRGSFYHAGQVCVSIQKVIIHEEIIDEFIKLLKKNISKIKIGDPTNNSTDVGPLIRPSEVIRIDGVVKKAIKDGAELICGGSKETETSYKCTVLKNPKESSEISKNEIFGPVLCIYSYKEINDAINKANHDEYAFQTSIYTNNIETALLCYEKLDAKSVFVNEQTAFRVDWMPFGGIKNSGEGTGGIEYSFSDLLYDKMIVLNSKKITT